MDFRSALPAQALRVISVITLIMGLVDAGTLLGLPHGDVSPLTTLGTAGFTWMAMFCIAHLFAAVGLWIRASWGAVTLNGAFLLELILTAVGNPHFRLDIFGILLRIVIMAALSALLFVNWRARRAHD